MLAITVYYLSMTTLQSFHLSQLQRVREWRGMTQEQLSEAANISLSTLQKQERGAQRDASLSIAIPLARALGVSVEALSVAEITNKLLKAREAKSA